MTSKWICGMRMNCTAYKSLRCLFLCDSWTEQPQHCSMICLHAAALMKVMLLSLGRSLIERPVRRVLVR
jgi:hypothetical protein